MGRLGRGAGAKRLVLCRAARTRWAVASTPSSSAFTPIWYASAVIEHRQGIAQRVDVRMSGGAHRQRAPEPVRAVNSASFDVRSGGSLAPVGESGSGKATIARMLVGLEEPDAGSILINRAPRPTRWRDKAARLAQTRSAQLVFRDPHLCLDPRITVGGAVEDALRLHGKLGKTDARKRVLTLPDQIGLSEQSARTRPRALSGCQCQRMTIDPALAVEPRILVIDGGDQRAG